MSKAGLDNRQRNQDGEISHKHGATLIGTLRKIYGQGFAAGNQLHHCLDLLAAQAAESDLRQIGARGPGRTRR